MRSKKQAAGYFDNQAAAANSGFTIIELLIAMAASALVMAAIYVLFVSQQRHYMAQSQVVEMQQNLRSGTGMMESDLRMVGYSPVENPTDTFGLRDITKRNLDYTLNANGNSTIQFSVDLDEDGVLDNPNEIITYSLANFPDNNAASQDGIADLTRSTQTPVIAASPNNNRQLISENIEALGIAYAFDLDGDDKLDVSAKGNVIWAVDTNNDNVLDRLLDTDDDGDIDVNDTAGGSALGSAPALSHIRSARVWALARAGDVDPEFSGAATYVIAERRIVTADNFRRRLLEFTMYFRNAGL